MVELLLRSGAEPNADDGKAVQLALINRNLVVVHTLIRYGAKLNQGQICRVCNLREDYGYPDHGLEEMLDVSTSALLQ
jgi:hypothetical protein